MTTKKRVLKWFIGLTSLLIIQTATFYLVGPRMLRHELLPDYFQMSHQSDSAYVRDFYVSKLDFPYFTPLSHHLEDYPDELKKKLKVSFIYFARPDAPELPKNKSPYVVYYTWMQHWDWMNMSGLFEIYQVEHLVVDGKRHHRRDVRYRWCMFFWIKTFEFIESSHESIYSGFE